MNRMEDDIEISNLIFKHLRGETSDSEEEILEAWCLNPKHQELLDEIKNADFIYEDIDYMDGIDSEAPYNKIQCLINKRKRSRIVKYAVSIAAVFAIGIFSLLFLRDDNILPKTSFKISNRSVIEPNATLVTTNGNVFYLKDSIKQGAETTSTEADTITSDTIQKTISEEVQYNILTTSNQGTIKIVLYDGTSVWINAGSELQYPNSLVNGHREVYLKGEAYFDVEKDSLHPFIVKTNISEVKVLGTSFNIDSQEDKCITTLVNGHIRMKYGEQDSVDLRAGQQATMEGPGKISLQEVDTRYYTGWIQNLFTFRETKLSEIADVLEKWYGCEIRFDNPVLRNIPFTTIVERYSDVNDVLQVLEGTKDFRYIQKDNVIIIKKR